MAYDPYAPDALFRCDEGHGTFRREQCRIRRGSIACPVCLSRNQVVGTLRYTGQQANDTLPAASYDADYLPVAHSQAPSEPTNIKPSKKGVTEETE